MNARDIIAMAGDDLEAQINLLAANYNNQVRLVGEVRTMLRKRTAQRDRLQDFLLEIAGNTRCTAGSYDDSGMAACEHCRIVALVRATSDD